MNQERWARARPAAVWFLTALLGVIVGSRFAHAVIGGETPRTFAFSGTLTGTTGPQTLTFTFRSPGGMCAATVDSVTPEAGTGAFQANIPIASCPASVLDDPQATVSVSVGSTTVVSMSPIQPVPFARYAERLGTSSCPTAYDLDASETMFTVCRRGMPPNEDVVVKVGDGSSAFWIDRYEASVWTGPLGTGRRQGESGDNYLGSFPDNGQWSGRVPPVYATSRPGVTPSRELTWFQAMEACRAAGKRLPTGQEWLAAARATPDGGGCVVLTSGPRETGMGNACQSAWGAQDMIGNLWEWTDEWYAGVGPGNISHTPWPSSYGAGDGSWNIASSAYPGGGGPVAGLPAAARRGGYWNSGGQAGVFALDLNHAPSNWSSSAGFRCVIDR